MSNLSLLSKDYKKLREELIKKIPELTDRWTDYTESDIGITLLELLAGIGEMLSFYLDRNVNECFLANALQRKNVVNLAKSLGYTVKSATTSTGNVQITCNPPYTGETFIINKFSEFKTTGDSAVKFFSTEDVQLIGSGIEIPLVQGEKGEQIEISTGETNMSFVILESIPPQIKPIAFNYIEVYVNSEKWTRVDTLILATSDEKCFMVESNYDGSIYIKFGGNGFGLVPEIGSEIKIIYAKTDCINVGANTIKVIQVLDELGNEKELPPGYIITVNNNDAFYNGKRTETIEEIKQEAPLIYASAGRVVTKDDYKAWISQLPAVSKVIVWGENEENPPNYDLCNIVRYCVVPYPLPECEVGMEETPETLINEIENTIADKKVIGVKLEHIQFRYVDISLSVSIEIDNKYSLDAIRLLALEKINTILNPELRELGQDIVPSDFYKELTSIEGVKSVLITSLSRSTPVVNVGGVDLSQNVVIKELYKWELARPKQDGINIYVNYFYDRFTLEEE